ncbi:MAG: IPT/TIG domain-containing protein [Blastocatellia bacterium]
MAENRPTTFVSATELKMNLLASDTVFGKTLKITVFTPEPGGGTSPETTLTITNPAPTIASLGPNAAFKGDPGFTLTITGTNFVPTSVVYWNGGDRPTTFVSATQLTAAIPQTDLLSEGTANVTIGNPTPGGGTSNALAFKINALTGYEADVTPRPAGDNRVSIADWVLIGRFATGLDAPTNSSEFQRADCAPIATHGDGKISITDWVQAGRFAVGLDPITPAAGPSQPATAKPANNPEAIAAAQPEATRIVRARAANFTRGNLNALPIELEGQGNENGLSFTLRFDARQMLFSHVVAQSGWTVNVNSSQSAQGRIGLMLALSAGQVAQLGPQPVVTAYFAALGGSEAVTTEIGFDDQVFARDIADGFANALPRATYESAQVTISGRGIVNVRAASYAATELASDSIASAFGSDLASAVASANTLPLPTTLGGTSVQITDRDGVTKAAPLFFVSPSQINYLIPAGLAEGIASVTVTSGAGVVSRGSLRLNPIAPSIFAADASGKGWAAAEIVRVQSNGQQSGERVARYDANANQFVGVPIDFGPERGADVDKLFLVLYATGIRQRAAISQVKVKVGDLFLPVEYAGAQGEFAGLDQINVRLPRNLIGRGAVAVEMIVDGQISNSVKIQIQ